MRGRDPSPATTPRRHNAEYEYECDGDASSVIKCAAVMERAYGFQTVAASSYIDGRMDPVILVSARKHGVADEDMLHAYRHPIRVFEFDDLTMLIGADPAGRFLEVGTATSEGVEFIVHAMPARQKFLR